MPLVGIEKDYNDKTNEFTFRISADIHGESSENFSNAIDNTITQAKDFIKRLEALKSSEHCTSEIWSKQKQDSRFRTMQFSTDEDLLKP